MVMLATPVGLCSADCDASLSISEFSFPLLFRPIISPAPVVFPPTKCEAVSAYWQKSFEYKVLLSNFTGDTPVPSDKAPLLLQLLPGKVFEPGDEHDAGVADGAHGGGCTRVPGEAPDPGPFR